MLWPLMRLHASFSRLHHQAARLLRDRSQTVVESQGMCELSLGCHQAVFEQQTSNGTAGTTQDDPTKMQSISCTGMFEAEAHMEVPRHTKVGRENSRLAPCPSPPSLTLPSGPIPMCPAYTSVKNPKSGTLANSKLLHSGRKAYMKGHGVGWNGCSSTTRGWFKYAGAIVLSLLGCALAFSRSVVEGFSKPRRTIVEALSKDCRTSPEQQSNTRRRNPEESCVWTHAVAPARNGLGLALGLTATLFLTIMCLEARAQAPDGTSGPVATGNILSGTAITAVTNLPVEGATVRINGTENIAFTDKDGTFKISSGEPDGVLLVSYMGYETQQVPIQDGRLKNSHIRLTKDLSKVTPLIIGDSIPDYLWDLPVSVVNHPQGRSVVTLREYQSKKLLVLDFWARWCAPCVESVDQWEVIQRQFPDELAVLTVHMDVADRALPFIQQRGWSLPTLIGENYHIVNRHFFNRYQVGGVVMIYQGKLFAIPEDKGHDTAKLRKLLDGESVEYTSMIRLTNSETLEEGRAK